MCNIQCGSPKRCKYNDPKSKSEFPPLEMNITKSETGDEIIVHMNAILS